MERWCARTSVIAALALLSGCYATTPHRPEVHATVAMPNCMAAIGDVFTRAAFVPMQTPSGFTAFFAPRMGPRMGVGQVQRTRAALGVGVVVTDGADQKSDGNTCNVVLEALSNDGTCDEVEGTECSYLGPTSEVPSLRSCQANVTTCPMMSAPSPTNDALVDDFARRLREALGPKAIVSGLLHST